MAGEKMTVAKFQRGGNGVQLTEEFLKNHLQDLGTKKEVMTLSAPPV